MSIRACEACGGDGFVADVCGCREAVCPHTPFFGDGTERQAGIYHKLNKDTAQA